MVVVDANKINLDITAADRKHFQDGMAKTRACFQAKGMTCNVPEGQKIDDLQGCEVATIGRNFTWHTHSCEFTPSEADVATNKKLGKQFLCIGLTKTGTTRCFDLVQQGKVVAEFK